MSTPGRPKGEYWSAKHEGTPVSTPFDDVQRIVLRGSAWGAARHLMLDFSGRSPLHFLNELLQAPRLSVVGDPKPGVQISLGFTRRGLEHAFVPDPMLALFALRAPAFWAGATRRAAGSVGLTGPNGPRSWDDSYTDTRLDAVLSLHAQDEASLKAVLEKVTRQASDAGFRLQLLPLAAALPAPDTVEVLEVGSDRPPQWVHFGLRDSLSRIGIEGWTSDTAMKGCKPASKHKAGEFVLGHEQDSGANPWVAGSGQSVWPLRVQAFFRNGSFGVLQQIQQFVAAFENYVASHTTTELGANDLKGKLCGRYPNGRPLGAPEQKDCSADFDYSDDVIGQHCPFGSHVRRMNPRLPPADAKGAESKVTKPEQDLLAHFSRSRALLRRGMPYGSQDAGDERGLLGQFFCASIEDQYEHLLCEWADRVPLGSPDRGGARDPLIGAHEQGDGPFEIPRAAPKRALPLRGLPPFTQTGGVAYLFYPSRSTLTGIADNGLWRLGVDAGEEQGDGGGDRP